MDTWLLVHGEPPKPLRSTKDNLPAVTVWQYAKVKWVGLETVVRGKMSGTILVVRHGVDKQGDPFTATYELTDVDDGELIIARHEGTHPPKSRYTPEEFTAEGFHLASECPEWQGGQPIHLRDDFDGDFQAIPDCKAPDATA